MSTHGSNADMRSLEAIRDEARNYQYKAADPLGSAWVSANAGTGKTYVLVLRVLRLLLSGAPAESILCLTFTKAAAAEMSNRLVARLGDWAAMSNDDLSAELSGLLGRAPDTEDLDRARCLFAQVLDAPGGIKIMTIHAFCDRVLRRFPLEAGVPPSFTILTEEERAAAVRDAIEQVLQNASQDLESTMGKALATVIANAAESRFQELVETVISKRELLAHFIRIQTTSDPFDGMERALRSVLGCATTDSEETLLVAQCAVITDEQIANAATILNGGKKSDQDLAKNLTAARGASGEQRCEMLRGAFMTSSGEARSESRFITKAIRETHPALADALCRARDDFAVLNIRRRAVAVASATIALLRLADAAIQHYEDTKLQRSAVDFDGLIARTAALFTRSDAAAWVLFRLDASLSHILVDEAQDTSAGQWSLIHGLTSEFFAGEGSEDRPHTLFAVGDEKQSIYRFQGADPEQFIETGKSYAARAQNALQPWVEAPLSLSFRSTRTILGAVDLVFADYTKTPGLTAEQKTVKHFANREGAGGRVEIWPVIKPEKRDEAPIWEPFSDTANAAPPAHKLAARIAGQIRNWLDSGEILASKKRPIRPSDILILVRKRAPFAAPMVKALKSHGIPVAGADRMRLTEQLAVMDLMALGDAMLLPEDDLTLAALLKSPIIGLSEDDLFALAHGRSGSLWSALAERADDALQFREAYERLTRWRDAATHTKPFDFFAERLDTDSLRKKLLSRLGPDAADPIGEFLTLALAYEERDTPSMQGFLQWLRTANPEIKRDMDAGREEVRVMTVHGSKGLEANIVFLADSCSMQGASRTPILFVRPGPSAPSHTPNMPIWTLPKSQIVPAIGDAREAESRAEADEYQRLLYVAMTRARDRLYVAGFEGQRARSIACWYNLICDALAGHLTEAEDFAGNPVLRMEHAQTAPPDSSEKAEERIDPGPAPVWGLLDGEPGSAPVVFNPSRLETGASPNIKPAQGDLHANRPRNDALTRGRAAHRLLELLPTFDEASWHRTGTAYLGAEAGALGESERDRLLNEIIAILKQPDYRIFFGPDSRAEVTFSAEYAPMRGDNPPVMISGQIDRLVVGTEDILILDFKTGGAYPSSPEDTPDSYLAQLAAYRLAIARMFPGKPIKTSILWTEIPHLMAFDEVLLQRGERHLHEAMRQAHLDPEAIRT